jgi:hypothetical protein
MAGGRNLLTTMTLTAILAVLVYAAFAGPARAPVAAIDSQVRQIAGLGR